MFRDSSSNLVCTLSAVETLGLTQRFGSLIAVNNLNFCRIRYSFRFTRAEWSRQNHYYKQWDLRPFELNTISQSHATKFGSPDLWVQ